MKFSSEKGMALVITLVFMAILMMLGGFMINQSLTGLKITTALRDYEKAFNLADGACQIGLGYLTTSSPRSASWDPTIKKQIKQDTLPDHVQETLLDNNKGTYFPEIYWMGYDSKPMPGWMINWQGYSSYYRVHYQSEGTGTLPSRPGDSGVTALVVKVER